MTLLTEKHPNHDFFIADIFDQTPFKDDLATMEHPVFVLSKNKDMRMIEYKNGNTTITIAPSIYGLPTIFDKDFLLYCTSLLMKEVNAGRIPPKTLRVSSHDFFVATNRDTGGKSYDALKKTLDRLSGVRIKTNIKTNGRYIVHGFGVIDSYVAIESHKVKNRMIRLEITLSDWFYNSVVGKEMLTINRDYFRLAKPMERRLYEIARKHCGNQKQFSIKLERLFLKSGSSGNLRKFRFNLHAIIKDDHIPDYRYKLSSDDIVTIYRKKSKESPLLPVMSSDDIVQNLISKLKKATLINAEKLHNNSYADFDMKEIILQFVKHVESNGEPKTLDGAFIGFLKKKLQTYKM